MPWLDRSDDGARCTVTTGTRWVSPSSRVAQANDEPMTSVRPGSHSRSSSARQRRWLLVTAWATKAMRPSGVGGVTVGQKLPGIVEATGLR